MTHDPLCNLSAGCTCPPEFWPTREQMHGGNCRMWMRCNCALIAKVRADERDKTLDDAIALLWEMNCKRLWWDDMLTWCISVNEAIYNIDNLRGKKEGI